MASEAAKQGEASTMQYAVRTVRGQILKYIVPLMYASAIMP